MCHLSRAVVLIFALALLAAPWCASAPSQQVDPFAQEVHTAFTTDNGLPSNNVLFVSVEVEGEVRVGTDQGLAIFRDGQLTLPIQAEGSIVLKSVNWLPSHPPGQLVPGSVTYSAMEFAATDKGLFKKAADTAWERILPHDGTQGWAVEDVRALCVDSKDRLWFAALQGVGCLDNDKWTLYTGKEGLPYNDFTCAAAGPNGDVWFGTHKGVIRFDGEDWAYRQGKRWLVDDDVVDIAVDQDGSAWIATGKGISHISFETTTLVEKAAFYEDEIDQHHRRTPYGYVVNAGLGAPGDKGTSKPYVTDNDGQYTGLYAGAAALGYAVNATPEDKARAAQAFEALAFLSEVTQGGSNPAPSGFIARAIMPIDGPNPNIGDSVERDKKKRQGDKLWKIMDPRWPTSEDGKWYWKSDTSSDELDGHYFAYGLYYDHVAETDAEKARAREVVARVTDHLLDHDYRLVDHDGAPTRWARFSPKDLNDDKSWWTERGLNSLSVLTYLTIAHHVTGDQKYRDAYMELVEKHQYALNGMVMPKLQFGPGSHVQFDDKMAFMNYYHLIRYETDPELLNMYYTSIYYYWNIVKYERNPFFNFVYAACTYDKVRVDQWGELDLNPTSPWLEQSVDTLKRYPLDLANWEMDNRHRIDIQPLLDHTREPGRNKEKGYHLNNYVLPIDERQSLSWSEDTWALKTGGNGQRLRDGCPYLLAYYMGRHHGYIRE